MVLLMPNISILSKTSSNTTGLRNCKFGNTLQECELQEKNGHKNDLNRSLNGSNKGDEKIEIDLLRTIKNCHCFSVFRFLLCF